MITQLPVTIAALEKNDDLLPNGKAENNEINIEFYTRKCDYHKIFKLKQRSAMEYPKLRVARLGAILIRTAKLLIPSDLILMRSVPYHRERASTISDGRIPLPLL
jgi:hypothetical protein